MRFECAIKISKHTDDSGRVAGRRERLLTPLAS